MDLNTFLYPHASYWGNGQPNAIVFNANLQEFSQRVGYISALYQGGKLTSLEAYRQIDQLWQALERSRQNLEIDA
ncbi:hypothetical protein C7271_19190 [filamentous cyanobacterium CCP5]|nr:hypothetical protein C7271_19190 [filamentous cyanobacterium CCP5]